MYNIETGYLVANLNSRNLVNNNNSQMLDEQKMNGISCSLNGRFMCATTHDGYIQCYDLDSSHLKAMKVMGFKKRHISVTLPFTVKKIKVKIYNTQYRKITLLYFPKPKNKAFG